MPATHLETPCGRFPIRQNLVEKFATMSDREIVQLIFAEGFSTARAVTDVSGRGVGLDHPVAQRAGGSARLGGGGRRHGHRDRPGRVLLSARTLGLRQDHPGAISMSIERIIGGFSGASLAASRSGGFGDPRAAPRA